MRTQPTIHSTSDATGIVNTPSLYLIPVTFQSPILVTRLDTLVTSHFASRQNRRRQKVQWPQTRLTELYPKTIPSMIPMLKLHLRNSIAVAATLSAVHAADRYRQMEIRI